MKIQKKIFLVFALIFIGIMLYISYDIAVKTTFPGSKPQHRERLLENPEKQDTTDADTLRNRR